MSDGRTSLKKENVVNKPTESLSTTGTILINGTNSVFLHNGVIEHLSTSDIKLNPPGREWYLNLLVELTSKMVEITKKKNADYTGGSDTDDAFANFRQVERMNICTVEQGFLTRITDKLSRISSFVKKGTLQVQDESVEDTLLDMANYCILMLGYIKSKKGDEVGEMLTELEKREGSI